METERSLLIVEDDASFARALVRSFERRGYQVRLCQRTEDVAQLLETFEPGYAVVDLKLPSGSGLECVKLLHGHDPDMKIVVLTGFASIVTAVEAVKLGACHYLAKPSNTDDIEGAFRKAEGDTSVELTKPLLIATVALVTLGTFTTLPESMTMVGLTVSTFGACVLPGPLASA